MNWKGTLTQLIAAAALCLAPLAAHAEDGDDSGGETTVTATAPGQSESKFLGMVDLRPSYTSKQGEFHTENTLEAGYQLNRDLKLSYVQYFNTDMYNPQGKGIPLDIQDGFFRMKLSNILQSDDKNTSLNFQLRTFVPTYGPKRDAGFITTIRPYLTLKHTTLGGALDLIASEVPQFHAYTKPGFGKDANPIFENMFILEADIHLSSKLTFALPVILQHVRYRDYGIGATNNDSWAMTYWIWPELDYELSANHTIGVAYYSGNLVKGDLSNTNFAGGLEDGVFQLVYTLTL